MNRVRFAPSPTGLLHIGGARTYVFCWLFARSTGGQLVLRIDDTDAGRNTQESLRSILDGLEWLELPWDEQHYQSERRPIHVRAAEALLAKGVAYRDFTAEGAAEAERGEGGPWLFNPGMRDLGAIESDRRASSGEPFVIRFRVPREQPGGVGFKDLVFRKHFRRFADIEDFALLRANGHPTYHLASTVDDGEMGITHVIRGQDHLTNTFKHILLLQAMGFDRPSFAHLPLLLGPDGSKLSKRRHGPIVSVTNYRDMGFLPAGFMNYLSLLGWSPKDNREVLTVEQLVDAFRIEHVLRTNAVVQVGEKPGETQVDPKAVWLNGQHLRSMPPAQLLPYVEAYFRGSGWWRDEFSGARREWFLEAIDALRSRLNLLSEFPVRCRAYFHDDFGFEPKALANLDRDGVRDMLRELAARIERAPDFTEQSVEHELRMLSAEREVKAGLLINGSRAALTGQPVGPSAFRVFTLLGKDRVVARLRAV
ncbi:MAG: glutamate--tRNA ligase [Bryobacterales bacterium]|nr:glutamate--tRNA ligase [Bryobacterales bacterium]